MVHHTWVRTERVKLTCRLSFAPFYFYNCGYFLLVDKNIVVKNVYKIGDRERK